ncbi:hypothetical protein BKA62DRAFT_718107 [Auriculariales sp. MPI-PUGE-AT-0066]|nr:hypothetical protein BKA62DRAFT_718107 [Auriculariales sp. MPI-PUGE-AT-0066]
MNQLKNGEITGVVIAELVWTFILGTFWLAAAANQTGASLLTCGGLDIIGSIGTSAGSIPDFGGPLGGTGLELGDMGGYPDIGTTGSVDLNEVIRSYKFLCQQYDAVEAFSWLNWFILWAWMLSLLCLAIVGYNRGNKAVFRGSVGSTDFLATNVGSWQSEKSESEPPQYSNACPPKHQFAPQFSHEAVQPGAAS